MALTAPENGVFYKKRMRLDEELAQATPEQDSVLSIGVFDGVHRGHQHLIAKLTSEAQSAGHLAGVVTFRNHPDSIFRTDFTARYITSLEERISLIKNLGVDFVVPITFDVELAKVRAKDFAASLQQRLRMRGLVIGPDFAMGYKREGNVQMLSEIGSTMDFSVKEVNLLADHKEAVRSTNIREAITLGDMSTAADLLGRNFSITGLVVQGDQRGRELGYPTANIELTPSMAYPGNGIYATIAYVDGASHMAATSIGTRPTFDGVGRTIEAFFLDFDGNLYNKEVRLEFVRRLRDELKFDSIDALLEQMAKDVNEARQILSS